MAEDGNRAAAGEQPRLSEAFGGYVLGVAFIAFAAVAIARFVLGAQAFSVLTGSMYPYLHPGDLVIDVPADLEDIREGDVITFVLDEDLNVATHRVVEVDYGQGLITTKGDANDFADGNAVDYRNVVGVVRASLPGAGYVLTFLSTPSGKIVAITAVIAIALVVAIVRTLRGAGEDDEHEEKSQAQATGQHREERSHLADALATAERRAEAAEACVRERPVSTQSVDSMEGCDKAGFKVYYSNDAVDENDLEKE